MPQLKKPVDQFDHKQGNPDAPLVLVEYGDFECSFCGRAYPLVKAAQKDLGDKLLFVFRNFPISTIHPHAEGAAEAAEIAASGGKFWEMHDLLYENQSALSVADLVGYAEQLGLDRDGFIAALEGHTKVDEVRDDFLSGVRSGVNGTPTFFINGERYDGNWDHSYLLKALKESLPE